MCRKIARWESALSQPLILGAGPAGCVAAIRLAHAGAKPLLIDRDKVVGDAICGGFLSWRSAEQLRMAGFDLAGSTAHHVTRLSLYAGRYEAHAELPETGFGLSRHALDTALRERAVEAGASLEIDRIRLVSTGFAQGDRQDWQAKHIMLASGKHDVRGQSRPRQSDDPALGLRIRVPGSAGLHRLIDGRIELHFFQGGYAGIVRQESGSANICLALRKSLLVKGGGKPRALLDMLAETHPHFGARMAFAGPDLPIDTIANVPYGWIARDTPYGLYRLGDQAAVIPSLAGEGMSIAIASGMYAADAVLANMDARTYQRQFARMARRPVGVAKAIWRIAESKHGGTAITQLARLIPPTANLAMRASRIG
ncbi:hypothetical protein HME9302_00649 [Alteripontixanthobacter maritimus]|uniref:FAD-binding domain-containing protein n=1 Tax=Alteripontixanthobacter maritimus TaxID=2161824 RepID=A0A369Q968_9SPHN|nr:FAD-dependent monooxygenase [Alteripontixanthobacter maritimus]RDC59459.1 hypothetical protein HME9302_00649 [Alteripontixanthobacter maritimus]